jgi:hypothetical protein
VVIDRVLGFDGTVVRLGGGRLRWVMPAAAARRQRARTDGRSIVVLVPSPDPAVDDEGCRSWVEVMALLSPGIDGVTISARYPDFGLGRST